MRRRGSTYITPGSSIKGGPIYLTLYVANSNKVGVNGGDPYSPSGRVTGLQDLWSRGILSSGELSNSDIFRYIITDSQTGFFGLKGVWPRFQVNRGAIMPGHGYMIYRSSGTTNVEVFENFDYRAQVVDIKQLTGWTGRDTLQSGVPIFQSILSNNWTWQEVYSPSGSTSALIDDTGIPVNTMIDVGQYCASHPTYTSTGVCIPSLLGSIPVNYNVNGFSYAIKVVQSSQITGNQTGRVNGIFIG